MTKQLLVAVLIESSLTKTEQGNPQAQFFELRVLEHPVMTVHQVREGCKSIFFCLKYASYPTSVMDLHNELQRQAH